MRGSRTALAAPEVNTSLVTRPRLRSERWRARAAHPGELQAREEELAGGEARLGRGSAITCSRLELCKDCVSLIIREVTTYPDSVSLVVTDVDQDDVNEKTCDPWKP